MDNKKLPKKLLKPHIDSNINNEPEVGDLYYQFNRRDMPLMTVTYVLNNVKVGFEEYCEPGDLKWELHGTRIIHSACYNEVLTWTKVKL